MIYNWFHHLYRTTSQMKDYLKLFMMPRAKDSEVDLLLKYYPDDQRAGCPFDTGIKNALSDFARTLASQFGRENSRDGDQVHNSNVQPLFRAISCFTPHVGAS